jgi:hypothetical protein
MPIQEPSKRKLLEIPLPGGSGRAETGAVQFKNDWPGLFIRGDAAIAMAFSIRQLETALAKCEDVAVASSLRRLLVIAEIIERDVKV